MKIILQESWLFVVQSSQAKGNDAEDVERCCESKGDAIQVRNVHKERSRIPAWGCVCSTLSSPSLPLGFAHSAAAQSEMGGWKSSAP